jgi:GNAT superfamily N-acetyltransferase
VGTLHGASRALVIRDLNASGDADHVERLWRAYLSWGNDGLESGTDFGCRSTRPSSGTFIPWPKFLTPEGRLLLAVQEGRAVGTSALQGIGPETAEIKRMWVDPAHRRAGIARTMLDLLITTAAGAGYDRIRLDSPTSRPPPTRYTGHSASSRSRRTPRARYPTSSSPTGCSWSAHCPSHPMGGRRTADV